MTCPSVITGQQFLVSTLAHIDCQARTIGTFGFGALAEPGSMTSIALIGLLTVFVAIFGIRMLLGYRIEGKDLVNDVLKVAIVLTLATIWPAWRVIGYDLVIEGPAQLARAIGLASHLPGSSGDFASRLQHVDQGMSALNGWGSGRLGVAQGDWFQLGFARIAWLVGTIGPLALVRISAGILLAIAPLMAGLLLFGATRSLFEGWLRALAMTFLASLLVALILGVQMALLEPWLADTLQRRATDVQTLDAPVEILVLTVSFALVSFGAIALTGRIAFHPDLIARYFGSAPNRSNHSTASADRLALHNSEAPSRAVLVASSISASINREERLLTDRRTVPAHLAAQGAIGDNTRHPNTGLGREPLGSSHRRSARRMSNASTKRDSKA